MYKIIYTNANDFIRQEAEEHGYDYVDAQFALGYEVGLIDGSFFAWVKTAQYGRTLASTDVKSYCQVRA